MTADTNVELDPILTNDLTDVSPEQPLVPSNEYNAQVKKMEQRTSESSGGKYINIQLQSIDPIVTVAGETLPAGGMTFFGRITITPTEKRSKEAIQRDLKRFQLACGVKSGNFFPFEQYEGKNIRIKVGFSKKSPEYPDDRNEVKGFVIP